MNIFQTLDNFQKQIDIIINQFKDSYNSFEFNETHKHTFVDVCKQTNEMVESINQIDQLIEKLQQESKNLFSQLEEKRVDINTSLQKSNEKLTSFLKTGVEFNQRQMYEEIQNKINTIKKCPVIKNDSSYFEIMNEKNKQLIKSNLEKIHKNSQEIEKFNKSFTCTNEIKEENFEDEEDIEENYDSIYQQRVNKMNEIQQKLKQTFNDFYKIHSEEIDQGDEENEEEEIEEEEKIELLSEIQINEIEKWTNKKFGEKIFDSETDNWKKNTSLFDDKLYGRSNVLILIQEEDNKNIFGGYIDTKIFTRDHFINDKNAFIFTMNSKRIPQGMKRINCIQPQNSFVLCSKNKEKLFFFGGHNEYGTYEYHDIILKKQDISEKGSCNLTKSYDYTQYEYIAGDENFYVSKILVYQMK